MSPTCSRHGLAHYTDLDWSASFAQAPVAGKAKPCSNPDCPTLTTALYCSPDCRDRVEGPDRSEPDGEWRQEPTPESARTPDARTGLRGASDAVPLYEAPCSVTVRLSLWGHEGMLFTMRDTDEHRLLERLAALLAQVPKAATPQAAPEKGWCTIHHVALHENEKNGQRWWSHRLPEGGFCKGK
jgi:hypothetical protein